MTTYVPAKKGVEYIFYAGLVSQSTGQFQSNPTLAAGDFRVSIDGGALNNLATLPGVTPASSRMVKFTLSTSEMNGDNITVVGLDAAGAEWDEIIVSVQTSAQQIDDLATPTNITAGTITTVTNLTNLPAVTSNWLTAAGIAASALNGKGDWNIGKTGYALSSAGVQAIWDALTSALTTIGSIGKLLVDNINATISSRLASASYTAPLDAAGTRSAIGLASANLDTQLDALPTAAENADAVLDEDMTAHQTQGSLGQAIGDPVADTNTIYKAVVTDADFTTIGGDIVAIKNKTDNLPPDPADESILEGIIAGILVDTTDIQSRLPVQLSGDGFIKADMKSIDDELTAGNNATLNLKKLKIQNSAGNAVQLVTTGNSVDTVLIQQQGLLGSGAGVYITSDGGAGVYIDTQQQTASGLAISAIDGDALSLESGTGKSINALQDIAVSDGDLTLTNIAKKVLTLDWTTVTGEAIRSTLNALRKLRNKVSFASPTLTVYKEDGTTSAYTQTVTNDSDQEPFKELGN